jgi:hypothetical protein
MFWNILLLGAIVVVVGGVKGVAATKGGGSGYTAEVFKGAIPLIGRVNVRRYNQVNGGTRAIET